MTDRETLESEALEAVCACRYYDIADTLDEASDDELRAIINHENPCEICGQ